MKKKKNKNNEQEIRSAGIKFPSISLKNKKILLILFLFGFILSLIVSYTGKNINVGDREHGKYDATHYYKMSKIVKENLYPRFFSFLSGVFFDTLSKQEYQKMGFYQNDIESIYRAPAIIFTYGCVFYLFGESPDSVLVFNAFLFGLDMVLIFLISMMLYKNRKLAILLAGIFCFYISYHLANTFLAAEVMGTFTFLLLAYFFVKAIQTNKPLFYMFTGMLIYINALIKISNQYAGHVIIIVLIIYIWKSINIKKELRKKLIIFFLMGLFLVLLPWRLTCYRVSGEFSIINVLDPEVTKITGGRGGWRCIDPSTYGMVDNAGLSNDQYFRKFINDIDPKYKNNSWYYFSLVCGKAWKAAVKDAPGKVFIQSMVKIFLMMISPAEAQSTGRTIIFSPLLGPFNYVYHNLIIILGIIPLFFLLGIGKFSEKMIFLLIIAYHYFIYGFAASEFRYALTAISSFILLSGTSILWIRNNLSRLKNLLLRKKYFLYLFILIIINIGLYYLIWNNMIKIVILNMFFIILTFLIYLVSSHFIKPRHAMISSILMLLFLTVLYNSIILLADDIDKYFIKLSKKDNPVVKQEILLPDNFDYNKYDEAVLAIDMKVRNKNDPGIKIKINDKLVREFSDGLEVPKDVLYYVNNTSFNPYENKWVFIKFDLNLIKNMKKVNITLEAELQKDSKSSLLIAYDNGIKFPNYKGGSFFRNVKHNFTRNVFLFSNQVDTRIIKKYKFLSKSSESLIITKNKINKLDGQLRIRLLLKNKGGYYVLNKYSALDKYYIGFIALINPVDRKMVKWLVKPDKEYIPASINVRKYLESEKDRYYTGYDIF